MRLVFDAYGTGAYDPIGTVAVHDRIRATVKASPWRIPYRETAWAEYSEQLGRYRHCTRPASSGRPNR